MSAPTLRLPPSLAPGARVALVSPAGPLRGPDDLERAAANARSFGWEPVIGAHALDRAGYFAGADADRLADLNAAIADPRVDGIWCVRGGYGAMRLLDRIDYDALRRHPKALLGYSDITALHAAIGVRCGLVSFHAPTARAELTPFSRDSLARAVVHGEDGCGVAPEARVLRDGQAEGRLAGGNLALLAALAGTPFAPSLDGAILVIEDVNEAVYRVDRMLHQLLLSGMLRGCRALVAGAFTECSEESDDGARSLDDVLGEIADALRIPCLAGVPVGHIDDQWTLPLGAPALVDTAVRRLSTARATSACFLQSSVPPGAGLSPRTDLSMPPKSYADLVADAKQRITEITPQDAKEIRSNGGDAVFLDVREPNEWNLGHVPGALHIPRGILESNAEQRVPRDRKVVVYCAGGSRSALAAATMRQMGYDNVVSISEGWRGWVQAGGEVEG